LFINGEHQPQPVNMKLAYVVVSKDKINERHFEKLEMNSNDYSLIGKTADSEVAYKMFLTEKQVEGFKSMPFVTTVTDANILKETSGFPLFPANRDGIWSKENYGPLLIPEAGMKVTVNDSTLAIYGEIITNYEGHKQVEINSGQLTIDGEHVGHYTFRQNYYFMMGDNRDDSLDSRYWGFVPEDHVLGKPLFIWFSKDGEAGLLHKVRWSRIFTLVK
jgi:signal peptidase I